ncbi:MAG: thioredoxin-disulfide reductase [Candidatus Cloacimonadota bacterium]|nr:MAG: thioredoxin-disulfide reductase [Candidatus Cloacimonadota bacterium]
MQKVTIIGHGPAGLTAAIYTARAGLDPLVLSSSSELGQLDQTTDVENFPGFPDGIMGPEIIVNMHKQAEKFGAKFKISHVLEISGNGPYTLKTDSGEIQSQTIIIATGAKPKKLGLKSEEKYWGQGVTACAVCDGFFYKGLDIVVIGGGDSACEEAIYLTKFASKVTLIHRRDKLRASKVMADKVKAHPKVDILWNKTVKEVLGNENDGVTGALLTDTVTSKESQISFSGFFLSIGHIPNTGFLGNFVNKDEEGYVIVESGTTKTSKEGIFSAGDLSDKVYRQAITAAGQGCMSALDSERYIAEKS